MRKSKADYYLSIAEAVLARSTCLRRKYGAVIVKADEIIATGYNGSPRGSKNCCDVGFCVREKEGIPPSVYLTWKNQAEEVQRMEELVGDYQAYLRSPEWQEIRRQALLRDSGRCQMCGTGINLRVHHVHYEHVGTEQELEDVITLCEECHSKVHVKDNAREAGA